MEKSCRASRKSGRCTTLFVLFLAVFATAVAQTVQSGPPRDASALEIAQTSLTAMGGTNLSSGESVAMTGILELNGSSPASFPITIKTRGTNQLRSELTTSQGTRVVVISGGTGAIRKPDGTIRSLASENVNSYRNQYLPAFSLLSESNRASTSVENLGIANVDGSIANVVALGVWSPGTDASATRLAQSLRTIFYIDGKTGLVLRIQQLHYSENASGITEKMEIRFSDYRSVQGVQIPFRQQTYIDGSLLMDLTFDSVTLNAATDDADFTVGK